MRNLTRKILLSVGLACSLVIYQNCSEVGFGPVDGSSSKASSSNAGSDLVAAPEQPDVVYVEQCGCSTNNIEDIVLNVAGVYIGETKVVTATGFKSLLDLSDGFNIILDKPVNGSQIRLVLNDTGNRIVGENGKNYRLKVPSGAQSGLKINLGENKSFLGNTAYTIRFYLDVKRQVVRSGYKCILKPVLHATDIVEAEF